MADTVSTTAPKSVAVPPKAKAAPKPKAEPKAPRYSPDAKLSFLKNKDGTKTYGPVTDEAKNIVNPKRGKAKDAFAQYAEGITIGELAKKFEKLGTGMNQHLDWDIKHGFITVK